MTYANIKLGMHDVHDENNQPTGKQLSVIFPLLKPLIEELALKYPNWEFVESDSRMQWETGGVRYRAADGFKVMEKREELGTIRIDHWCSTGKRFWIDNFRIDAQKSRGSGFKTKHQDKAMKYVTKYFGAKDHAELVEAAQQRANDVQGNVLRDLRREVQHKWHRLDDYAADFLMTNWGEFTSWLTQKGSAGLLEVANSYPEAYANYEEGKQINELINSGKAWLVKISNSDYIVKQGEQVSVLTSESLPTTVRRNLGMLKLVQDGQMISNVGIRVSESTYYVLGETA